MQYLGYAERFHFMQAGDTVYIWVSGAWKRFCAALRWFDTLPGKTLRQILHLGYLVNLV